jgi:hypothetical protein
MRIWTDENLAQQGVKRRGLCLVTTRPQPPEQHTTGRMVTYATASRAVPTRWQRVASIVQGVAGWLGLLGCLCAIVARLVL